MWAGALENLADALLLVDAESRVLSANRAAGRMFEMPPASLVGVALSQLLTAGPGAKALLAGEATGKAMAEAGPQKLMVQLTAGPASPVGRPILLRPIPAASAAAEPAETWAEAAWQQLPDAVHHVDARGRVRGANATAHKLFSSHFPRLTRGLDPPVRRAVESAFGRALEGQFTQLSGGAPTDQGRRLFDWWIGPAGGSGLSVVVQTLTSEAERLSKLRAALAKVRRLTTQEGLLAGLNELLSAAEQILPWAGLAVVLQDASGEWVTGCVTGPIGATHTDALAGLEGKAAGRELRKLLERLFPGAWCEPLGRSPGQGALLVWARSPQSPPDERTFIRELSRGLVSVIESAQHEHAEGARDADLQLQLRCQRAMRQGTTEEAIATQLCRILTSSSAFTTASLWRLTGDEVVRLVAMAGDRVIGLPHAVMRAYLTQQVLTVRPDGTPDEPWAQHAELSGLRVAVALPGVAQVLFVGSERPDALSGPRLALLKELTADLELALADARNREALTRTRARLAVLKQQERLALEAFNGWFYEHSLDGLHFHIRSRPPGAFPSQIKLPGPGEDHRRWVSERIDQPTAAMMRALATSLSTGERRAYDIPRIRLRVGGRWRWFESHAERFGSKIWGVCMDITHQVEAEAALIQTEARLRAIAQVSPVLVLVTDARERVVQASPACLRILGRSPEALTGQLLRDLATPAARPLFAQLLRQAMARGGARLALNSLDLLTADGVCTVEGFIVDRSAVPGVGGMVLCAHDVTALKAAQATRDLLFAAAEHAGDGIVVTELTGAIEYVNPAFVRMTGLPLEELKGERLDRLQGDLAPGEDYTLFWRTLLEGRPWSGRFRNTRPDGSVYQVTETVSPVRDEHGRLARFVAVFRDVSDQERLEAQLRQAQRLEATGRLAGGIAHDFNNFLTSILGYVDFALDATSPDASAFEELVAVKSAAVRASHLTRQLLAFSRRQPLERRIINPNQVLAGMERMLRRLVPESVHLELQLGAGLGRVCFDPALFEQSIVSLMVFALDGVAAGGGRVTITTSEVERAGRGLLFTISVMDDGPALAPDLAEHLFDPFVSAERLGRGTGLGLALIRSAAEQGGGEVTVSLTGGTTISLSLPRQLTTSELPDLQQPLPRANPGETLLVVDDEPNVRTVTRRTLETLGYSVMEAQDGLQALALLESGSARIDLVVTDVVMPRLNGPALAHRARQLFPRLPILFVSGYTGLAGGRKSLSMSRTELLSKPFTRAELAQRVRSLLALSADDRLTEESP